MAQEWTVRAYQDSQGRDPIQEWLRNIRRGAGPKAVAKIERAVDLLKANGLGLTREYLHKVRGDLWELRATYQKNPYRILFYNPQGTTIVLLHGFHKTTDAIPQSDIDTAERRMADHKRRQK